MYDIPKLLTTSGYGDPDYTTRTIGNCSRRDNIRHKSQNFVCALRFQFYSRIGKPDRQKTMIVLTAGVLGISPSLFEAARVDGASSWQIFKSVTLEQCYNKQNKGCRRRLTHLS